MICLSLHPVRETLPGLLLLRPALCPLFNPAERPGNGGSKLISSGVRTDNAFVAVANVKLLLSTLGWVSGAGTTTNAVRGIWSDAVLVYKPRRVFAYSSYLSPKHINPQMRCFSELSLSIVRLWIQIRIPLSTPQEKTPLVMWGSSNVIEVTLWCDSFTSEDRFVCSTVSLMMSLQMWASIVWERWGWERAWIRLVSRKRWLVPLCHRADERLLPQMSDTVSEKLGNKVSLLL